MLDIAAAQQAFERQGVTDLGLPQSLMGVVVRSEYQVADVFEGEQQTQLINKPLRTNLVLLKVCVVWRR